MSSAEESYRMISISALQQSPVPAIQQRTIIVALPDHETEINTQQQQGEMGECMHHSVSDSHGDTAYSMLTQSGQQDSYHSPSSNNNSTSSSSSSASSSPPPPSSSPYSSSSLQMSGKDVPIESLMVNSTHQVSKDQQSAPPLSVFPSSSSSSTRASSQLSPNYYHQLIDNGSLLELSSFSGVQSPQEKWELDNRREEEREDEVHVCQWNNCGAQLRSLEQLVAHLEHAHTLVLQTYVCLWKGCNRNKKPFDARYKLITHLRCHTGERPYCCTYGECVRKFSRLENLKLHVRTHTGEKPYLCHHTGCGKKFNNTSDRAKHMKTHITRKPYVCKHPGCNKAYTDPSSMRKHVKFSHKAKSSRVVESSHNQSKSVVDTTSVNAMPTPSMVTTHLPVAINTTPTASIPPSPSRGVDINQPMYVMMSLLGGSGQSAQTNSILPISQLHQGVSSSPVISSTHQLKYSQINHTHTQTLVPMSPTLQTNAPQYMIMQPPTSSNHTHKQTLVPMSPTLQTNAPQYMIVQPPTSSPVLPSQRFNTQVVSLVSNSSTNQFIQPVLSTTVLQKQQPVVPNPTFTSHTPSMTGLLPYPPQILLTTQQVQPVIVPVLPVTTQYSLSNSEQ